MELIEVVAMPGNLPAYPAGDEEEDEYGRVNRGPVYLTDGAIYTG